METNPEPLSFPTEAAALAWAREHGGLPHSSSWGDWIVLIFEPDGVFAWCAPDQIVHLPDW